MAKKAAASTVYQLKITLKGAKPPIWRRVQVQDCSLDALHAIIQTAMGWHSSHLYMYEIDGAAYGDPATLDECQSDRTVKLSDLAEDGVTKFRYIYDMGDDWEHTILVEKVVAAEPSVKYPTCIGGKRACPPEDCGGVWGYADFLDVIGDPKHKDHAEMLEWAGGEFDPEAFSLDETNNRMGWLTK